MDIRRTSIREFARTEREWVLKRLSINGLVKEANDAKVEVQPGESTSDLIERILNKLYPEDNENSK